MNPYQFRFDGSPEAKEAIRLINEKYPNGYTFCGEWGCLYNNFGESGDYRYETVTPAQFVARMKGVYECTNEYYGFKIGDVVAWGNARWKLKVIDLKGGNLVVEGQFEIHPLQAMKLTLTDRIRHAYPSLSAEDVEQIVKMVREDEK